MWRIQTRFKVQMATVQMAHLGCLLLFSSLWAGEITFAAEPPASKPVNSPAYQSPGQASPEASATDDPPAKNAQSGLEQKQKNCIAPDSDLLKTMVYRNWDPLGLVGQPTQDARLVRVHVQDLEKMTSDFSRTNEVEMRAITSIEVEGRDGSVRTFTRPANTDYKYVKEFLNSELKKLSKDKGTEVEKEKPGDTVAVEDAQEHAGGTAVKNSVKAADKPSVNSEVKEEGKALLDKKRAEHASWSVRQVGRQAVVIDDRGAEIGMDGNGGAYGRTTHSYHDSTRTYYGRETIQGQLLSYQGNDVVLTHVKRWNPNAARGRGAWVAVTDVTVKYGNLDANDQKFLGEYRKLEKESTVK